MANELVYTSAVHGVRPGTRGFCTVLHTRGMSLRAVQLLEALSCYKSAYSLHDGHEQASPVSWSHYRAQFLGRSSSVLSRVCEVAPDHTARSNKLAHHLLISQSEQSAGGPAWLCSSPGLFLESWSGEPQLKEQAVELPRGDETECRAEVWEALTGDAGHAGVLASSFRRFPERITALVVTPEMDALGLIREALRLLPPSERWNVTFNTYFTSLPAGASCVWRCVLAESDELRELRRHPRVQVMDLTQALPEPPGEEALVARARSGEMPSVAPKAVGGSGENKVQPNGFKLLAPRKINQINLRPRGH